MNRAEALFTDGMGEEILAFAAKIYPICRGITGNGLPDTLHRIRAHVPLEIHEVPTGTAVFDSIGLSRARSVSCCRVVRGL